ncbi:hypothetical protein A3D84_02505 [Candidatus Woesebacteria bacterium RIFCSPHIGHO2_02_FULL_42_20]|uniref:S-adenosyl-l-methionine hydroxide adenosyltransferase C-terminal domain-containing protein n=1 Tax=Candidatus Woesebacteria bacterium RIFCSPHIGHO2_12_FULL_41_24 TaxID=1802510 RepID=A0A1F8APK2_9BACT|nr:MAG: hypothetical protein A2W15_02700 [Candidatus Woesebacteria bacterium RBG_16_41_13]OGM29216.1 MAG: hypothetical protein A2873_03050 [Candidatus Woesebacteria bacterium RIFCSPHIGHO2_01_FULL_42_80]OGM34714.1 MAG: hypothetical protein A3D84_02505 [Candidatus Woesebacteria bacterium RIFCSPHIGHO2_02_FULL_42_20]OGM53697.1 MAG: hypothetical protein A3E44_02335 [Candidatus Woesebacteria bacterium RIFCSPHIGHO2_12_FULL_41_24]OGM67013.1 MAG: hypothetical protein A2969_05700 [Candidatus Woesebacteri
MFITIINDCKSENDIGRQETRWACLFPNTLISFVGVDSNLETASTLEAAGNLVDILDASEGSEGVILLNVAPRGQTKDDGENGSRFCYFWYKNTLVVSTIKGYNLSLVKKLNLVEEIYLLDISKVIDFAIERSLISQTTSERVVKSQFRSFDFTPWASRWLWDGRKIPSLPISINQIADVPVCIWYIDSFGNAKTTLLDCEVKKLTKKFKFYQRLKDVPDGETAFYIGSSGIGNQRFIELATQNRVGSAAFKLNLKVGDKIRLL